MQPHGLGRRHLWSDTDAQHSVASSRSANHGRLALVSAFLVRNLDSIEEELLGHLDAGEELLVAVVARLRDKAGSCCWTSRTPNSSPTDLWITSRLGSDNGGVSEPSPDGRSEETP